MLNHKHNNINQTILNALNLANQSLSEEALISIRNFVDSKRHKWGGFVDRSGKPDLYYSIFGYSLLLIFGVKIKIERELNYLNQIDRSKLDFVHSVCLVRAYFLIDIIDARQKSALLPNKFLQVGMLQKLMQEKFANKTKLNCFKILCELDNYISADGGYNHNQKFADQSTVYANYLMFTLHQDLLWDDEEVFDEIAEANLALKLENGSFANENNSQDGITSASAAGILLNGNLTDTMAWIKNRESKRGGFVAANSLPMADLLSTATALLALQNCGEPMKPYVDKNLEFVNLHWDESGGFFGSIADMTCDVEYTYYALLSIGILS